MNPDGTLSPDAIQGIIGFYFFVTLFVSGLLSAFVAYEKNRSRKWFFIGLFFGPLALLALAGLPMLEERRR